MQQLQIDKDINRKESFFNHPTVMLLDEKQWLYIQKRYRMTPRELQIAILVCRGFNNYDIAKALKIRPGTVKTHLRNIYRRVQVKSKIALLLKFVADTRQLSTKPTIVTPIVGPRTLNKIISAL